ncbi:hypothetical protein Alg130_11931, partial [Pyrenophora tritici-repentis]
FTIESSRAGTPTISSATPPAHATGRDTASAKRKVSPSNSCPNDFNATKRHRQNAATPVEPTLRESASTSRGSSEHIRHTPPLENTYVSPLAVPTLAATSSKRASVILNPPFHHAQGGLLGFTNAHTNKFVAVNRTSTNTYTAPSPSVLIPDPHPLMSHDTDQQYGPRSNETAGSREVSFEQCDLLSLLLNYLFPRESAHVEESIMLRSLEQVWTSHEQDFGLIMKQRFNDHQKALHIWIGQRRKTSQLQMMIDRQPSAQTLEMVDRVLVMNDLRILQLKWKALRVHVHSQDSTPGDLLCSTFAIMTRTQGTEALFKEGLERLKETSPE